MRITMRDFYEQNCVTKVNLMTMADKLREFWLNELAQSFPQASENTRAVIVEWLLGNDPKQFEVIPLQDWETAIPAMEYRWKILRQRYLEVSPETAYRNLMIHLGSLIISRHKIQVWISQHRDSQGTVLNLLESVLQELLQNDNYIQEQMTYIATLTNNKQLKNTLLFASLEEYCLRPINKQPYLLYLCIHYLVGKQLRR